METIERRGRGRFSREQEAAVDARALAILARDRQSEQALLRNERTPLVRATRRFACYVRDARNETARMLGGTPDDGEQALPAVSVRNPGRLARKHEERAVAARYVRARALLANAVRSFQIEGVDMPLTASVEVQNASANLQEAWESQRFTAHI